MNLKEQLKMNTSKVLDWKKFFKFLSDGNIQYTYEGFNRMVKAEEYVKLKIFMKGNKKKKAMLG